MEIEEPTDIVSSLCPQFLQPFSIPERLGMRLPQLMAAFPEQLYCPKDFCLQFWYQAADESIDLRHQYHLVLHHRQYTIYAIAVQAILLLEPGMPFFVTPLQVAAGKQDAFICTPTPQPTIGPGGTNPDRYARTALNLIPSWSKCILMLSLVHTLWRHG